MSEHDDWFIERLRKRVERLRFVFEMHAAMYPPKPKMPPPKGPGGVACIFEDFEQVRSMMFLEGWLADLDIVEIPVPQPVSFEIRREGPTEADIPRTQEYRKQRGHKLMCNNYFVQVG